MIEFAGEAVQCNSFYEACAAIAQSRRGSPADPTIQQHSDYFFYVLTLEA